MKNNNHLSINNMQRAYACMLLICLLIITGCKKSEPSNITEPVVKQPIAQYDTPFSKVPATSDIIMYEVNLRAFSSEGNLKGVQTRLDSIKALGVNVIWLMPIYPIGELKGVNSPYSVRNYMQVNSEFGTLEDLRTLVSEAHRRDMAVILDWVANHTSWDNPWIQNTAWYTKDGGGNIVSPNGWNDVADLNYNSQALRKEMTEAMKYWILTANVDGYRCDFADGVPYDFWKQAIDTIRSIPNRKLIMFAEGTRKDHFSAGFDLTFGWNFYGNLKDVFKKNNSTASLVAAHTADYSKIPDNKHILRFTSNHDDNAVDNSPVYIFNGQQGSLAAFVITSYMGGVPLIYSGQEIGYPGKLSFFDRTPIDWSINPEMTAAYKKIINFRQVSNAIRKGSLTPFSNNNDVVAFKKVAGAEQVLVFVNVRNEAINVNLDATLHNTNWTNAMNDQQLTLGTSVALSPYEYIILKNN